jgi:L-alanine-DL-glutamate epimerase-like enolase superfamily enzyme
MPQSAPIERVAAKAYRIPTDGPEADGTLSWDHTGLVVVEIVAAGQTGLGYSYTGSEAAALVVGKLREVIAGEEAFAIPRMWTRMVGAVRNLGWPGLCASAISAVDIALWDLKARLLGQPLAELLGRARDDVAIYGSGGFTSYSHGRLAEQLSRWVEEGGCKWVKMKVGSCPDEDVERVSVARSAIGKSGLFVDANGAYARKQALEFADRFAEFDVSWFEEPVSSDDLDGLHLIRNRAPAQIEIASGEYGYTPHYFQRMLRHEAVDVLQADATRCGGVTGFLRAAAIADAHGLPLSAHTAPAIHLSICCSAPRVRHIEWFHDHVRIEHMLFEGAPQPKDGQIRAALDRPGHGLEFKRRDAERYAV